MEFKLKYGPNFSIVDELQTFTVKPDDVEEGQLEVEVIGEIPGIAINYQYQYTYGGELITPLEIPRANSKRKINFKDKAGNWSVVVKIITYEYDPDGTIVENYELPGNWKVIQEGSGALRIVTGKHSNYLLYL